MKMRILSADEIGMLREHLRPLADYHNKIAETFAGIYPIVPLADALADTEKTVREGQARAEALFDEAGNIAGYCVAHFHGDTSDIDWLYVREDLRGQGWGKKLLESALSYLKENGAELVDVELVKGNPAKKFYREIGFEVRMEIVTKRL